VDLEERGRMDIHSTTKAQDKIFVEEVVPSKRSTQKKVNKKKRLQ